MGNIYDTEKIQYGVFCGEKKEGETQILRNKNNIKSLNEVSSFGPRTSWEALENNLRKGKGKKKFIGYRPRTGKDTLKNEYEWLTFDDVFKLCSEFARGLSYLNLCPDFHSENDGDFKFLGIYSRNKVEWYLSLLGAHAIGVTIVTIYDTLGEIAIEYILSQTQLNTIVIESKVLKKMLTLIKDGKAPSLRNLIVINPEDENETVNELKNQGIQIYTFEDICKVGQVEGRNLPLNPAKPDNIFTICYTSGTTGLPKGAMIPHHSIMVEVDVIHSIGFYLNEDDCYLSFLPMAHIMETLIFCVVLTNGTPFGIYNGNAAKLTEDAALLKPTAMCVVPRIFQRIYEAINKNVEKKSYFIRNLFKKGVEMKIKDWREHRILKNAFWDPLVFKEIRAIVGGRVRWMLVGSAPMDPYILDFLRCTLSCEIVEGYGQTEDCAGMLLTNVKDSVSLHLGGPGYSNEIKLIDCPDLDYKSTDIDPETGISRPRGEICVRGPVLFKGYLNDVENTKKAIDDDGWLHTGDVGMILTDHGNAIRIIDRVKNIFKLQQGEYVAPEKLENVLVKCKYVDQIFIYGDSFKNYLVAVVVPRKNEIIEFLKSKKIDANKDNYKDFFNNEDLKKEILNDMEQLGRKNDFKGFEVVKKIYLSPEEFTIENDIVTPTLKIKRHIAKNKFLEQINQMYESK